MTTNPSEANIHPLIMDLIGRIGRLEAENRELKGKMEQNSGRNEGNGPNWTGAIDNLEKKLMSSMEKISSDMEKLTQDVVFQKYEINALGIENEEMKRLRRETEDGLSCIRNDFSGRLKENSREISVSDAITALQEGIAEISHKIGRMEGKQNEDQGKILSTLAPLEENRQLIPGQVDKGTILVIGGEKDNRGSDFLKQDRWFEWALKLPKHFNVGKGSIKANHC